MSDVLALTVPETVAATYVVALPEPVADPLELARREVAARVGQPLRDMALHMLDTSLTTFHVHPAEEFPPAPTDVLRALGANADQLAAIDAATHVLVVSTIFEPGWPPAHEWVARSVAGAIAAALDAPLVDTLTPRVLDQEMVASSLPGEDRQVPLGEWVLIPQSSGPHGFWCSTKGLTRFGLPEIQTFNVPPQLALPWTRVLSGLGFWLLDQWAGRLRADGDQQGVVEIPSLAVISGADIDAAYGSKQRDAAAEGRQSTIKLRFDPGSDSDGVLTVVPPDDYPDSAGEYVAAVCKALFGAPESEIRYTSAEATAEAIASARDGLPAVRGRFTRGDLPLGGHVIVKHPLSGPNGGNEYVWAFVTSWDDDGKILGTCANDAEHDPAIRVGRTVTLTEDELADWAIWIDGEGIVEGGLTIPNS